MDYKFVYVLKNQALAGYYKIGMSQDVAARVKFLSGTSVPCDFECIVSHKTENAYQLERYLHEKLAHFRFNKNREFFTFESDEEAIGTVQAFISSFSPKPPSIKEIKCKKNAGLDTPSNAAKALGHRTLADAARVTGILPDTLRKYHSTKPLLFKAICLGALQMKGESNENTN